MEYFRNPWLDKEVKKTLAETIQWSSASAKSSLEDNYRREGQTVRVRKRNSLALQIVRFEQFEPEIRALLSDTRRVIRATFTAAAVRAFILENGRRLTQDTTSGLVALVDYELTIRCHARERYRLSLLVHEVQFIGSVSGGTFGEPTHIEYAPGVEDLIADMSRLPKISPIPGSQNEVQTREASIYPRLSGNGFDEQQDGSTIVDGSQAGFATQVPKSRPSKLSRQSTETVASPADPEEIRRVGAPTIFTAGQISTQVKRRANHNFNNLLSLLNPKAGVKQQIEQAPASARTSTTSPPDVQAPEQSITGLDGNGNGLMKQRVKADNTAASPSHSHGVPQKELGPILGGEQVIDLAEGRELVIKSVHVDGAMETEDYSCANVISGSKEVVSTAVHKPPTYVVSPIRAGSSSTDEANVVVNKEREEAMVVKNALADGFVNEAVPEQGAAVSTRKESELDPWAGMTRISRRELRIPKDQEELLNKKTCWLPPEPGERAPIANIPVPILKALTAEAESRAQREKEDVEAATKHSEIGSAVESSDPSDSDSDEPLSDWPSSPSPPRRFPSLDDMPPDSSPEQASQTVRTQRSQLKQKQPILPTVAKPLEKRGNIPYDDQVSPPAPKRQQVARQSAVNASADSNRRETTSESKTSSESDKIQKRRAPNVDAVRQNLEGKNTNRKPLPDFGFAEEAAFREGRDANMEHRVYRREFYRKAMANRPPTKQTTEPGSHAFVNLSQLPPTTAAPLTYSIRSDSVDSPAQSGHRDPPVRSAHFGISGPSLSATPTKSLTTTSPASLPPATNPVVDWLINTSPTLSETEDAADEEEQWYHDRNTPFKEFVRAYVQLKSVNGTMGEVDVKTGLIVPPKHNVDVLSWNDGYWLPTE